MNLTDEEGDLIFSIMQDLSGGFEHAEIRRRVGEKLLRLLKADYFASFVWDANQEKFVSCVQINMTDDNLESYKQHFQFRDPITPILQKRKKATPVSEIMEHERLTKTEFYNDFLKKDGLCYGVNYFAYDRGENIGDFRVWRDAKREDFDTRDAKILNALGPSLVNALSRAKNSIDNRQLLRFAQIASDLGLTVREAEVADLLVTGLSDAEICARLGISPPTLRTHIASIFRKIGINRRTQMAHFLTQNNRRLA